MAQHSDLDLERLHDTLRACTIGHTIDYHGEVASTMSLAHTLAELPATRSGHLVLAEEQQAGKGRRGRSWTAPFGQALLVSVLLKPPMIPAPATYLPMAACLAVGEAIKIAVPTLGDAVSLKWPNDVLLGHGRSAGKVAGILVESSFVGDVPAVAIVGIGINVNQQKDELPVVEGHMAKPMSLQSILGKRVDRTNLLLALCRQLEFFLDPQMQQAAILDSWRSRLGMLGRTVAVYARPDSTVPSLVGVAMDVASTGELLVRDADGEIHSLAAADVSIRDADP